MNKLKSTIALVSIIAFSFGCGQEDNKEASNQASMELHEDTSVASEKSQSNSASITFADENITEIILAYLDLKDALVATNGEKASLEAKNLLSILENSEVKIKNSLKSEVEKITNTVDTDAQRLAFDLVSQQILLISKSVILTEGKLYKQYCPMAKNNEGAFWLSTSSEIRNPYFGDKMLTCGSVEEEI